MTKRPLTDEQVARFHQDGYLFVEDFLDEDETRLLQQACRADSLMQQHAMDVRDSAGRRTNLSLWNHPGDDIYGMIADASGWSIRSSSCWKTKSTTIIPS
jgi:ectoine hydroxylase